MKIAKLSLSIVAVLMVLLCSACGLKGPLYLPMPEPVVVQNVDASEPLLQDDEEQEDENFSNSSNNIDPTLINY